MLINRTLARHHRPTSLRMEVLLSFGPWPQTLAILFGTTMLAVGITLFISPSAMTGGFGVPQKHPINPFVYLCAGREITLGLSLLLLAYLGEWRAIGAVMVALWATGLADILVDMKYGRGMQGALLVQGFPTALTAIPASLLIRA